MSEQAAAKPWELYCAIFMSGGAILAIELIASRLMAPLFGSSLYIWGAILSVTLACLSLGYSWGGRIADRSTSPAKRLVQFILLSALWVGLIPIVNYPVALVGLASGSHFGPIVVTLILFSAPITLLATATPLVFGALQRVTGAGHPARAIGDLFAISTLGSVAGALLTSYLMLPYAGLHWSLLIISISLITVTVPAIWRGTSIRPGVIVIAAICIAELIPEEHLARPTLNDGMKLLTRVSSRYNDVAVVETADRSRILLINGTSQSWVQGPDYAVSLFEYNDVILHNISRFPGHHKKALLIGLGAGTLARNLADRGYAVDIVEIDERVIEVAQRYFAFSPERFNIRLEDARTHLNQVNDQQLKYGLIVLDAGGTGSRPAHLFSREAFQAMGTALGENGLVITNQILFLDEERSQAAHHSAATVATVFDHVEAWDVYPDQPRDDLTNFIMVASDSAPITLLPMAAAVGKFDFDVNRRPLTDLWNPGDVWSVSATGHWQTTIRNWLGDAALIPL